MDRYTVELSEPGSSHIYDLPNLREISNIYTKSICIEKSYSRFNLKLSYYRNQNNPVAPLFFEDERFWYVLSGYVVEPLSNRNISDYFYTRGDCRQVKISLGGIYSYLTIKKSDGQISAGQSFPSWEPVYFSVEPTCIVVGSNPVFVHLQAKKSSQPRTRDDYFFEALRSGGVSCFDSTPFHNCKRLGGSKQLIVGSYNEYRIDKISPPKYGNHSTLGIKSRVSAYIDCLSYAAGAFKEQPTPVFQVSGGRDSRLLAAMFKANDIEVIPETNSTHTSAGGQIADRVAQAMGYSGCRRNMGQFFPTDVGFARLTEEKIRFQSGMPSAASPQYIARIGGHHLGHPMVYGHAHLQRGGLLPVKSKSGALNAVLGRMVNSCISGHLKSESEEFFTKYVTKTSRSLKYIQSMSQVAYFDWVMNYHYASFFSYLSNWHTPVTPLIDERFSLYCLDLSQSQRIRSNWFLGLKDDGEYAGIVDLHNDRIVMEATYQMCPELMHFPLDANRYRVEKNEPFRFSETSQTFSLRDPDSIKNIESDQTSKNYYPALDEVADYTLKYLEEVGMRSMFVEATNPDLVDFLSTPKGSRRSLSLSSKHVSAHLWSVLGLAISLKGDWSGAH